MISGWIIDLICIHILMIYTWGLLSFDISSAIISSMLYSIFFLHISLELRKYGYNRWKNNILICLLTISILYIIL